MSNNSNEIFVRIYHIVLKNNLIEGHIICLHLSQQPQRKSSKRTKCVGFLLTPLKATADVI